MSQISESELIKICYLYYTEGKSQDEISAVFGLSRFKVGRLLKQARDSGLVTIRINYPSIDLTELEVNLAQKWGLKQAIVVRVHDYSSRSPAVQVGEAGARYLRRIIDKCRVLGVAWGRSVSHMVQNVEPVLTQDLRIVQIAGGMGAIEGTDATALTMELGQRLQARAHVLQAPAIVENRSTKEAILRERQIRETLELARTAEAAIFGVGLPGHDGLLSRAGLLTRKTSAALEKAGAVGAICGRFFDPKGNKCTSRLDDRIIGLALDEIRRIPQKICIAFGAAKIEAISGALNGRFIDVLITDETTANDLMNRP